MTTKKRRTSKDDTETVTINDLGVGTVLTVTKWGRFNKLSGKATIRVGCPTCSDEEHIDLALKDAHKIGRLLLRLKPGASLKEMQVH